MITEDHPRIHGGWDILEEVLDDRQAADLLAVQLEASRSDHGRLLDIALDIGQRRC